MALVVDHHVTIDPHALADADTFLALRHQLPSHTQLIDGEVVVNSPTWGHQHVAGELFAHLRDWVRAAPGRGYAGFDLDVRIADDSVYKPDVFWLAGVPAGWRAMPSLDGVDLVAEVLSPSTRRDDEGAKRRGYEGRGVRELWLIDADAPSARLLRRSRPPSEGDAGSGFDVCDEVGADGVLSSASLPGFAVVLGDLLRLP
jgi:Uma2 family endonuclease